jgi:hypothetical protein
MPENTDDKQPDARGNEKPSGLGGLRGLDEAAGKALVPAAKEFGDAITPLGKRAGQLTNAVGILLIRALEPLVYGLEKSANWIEGAVSERLKRVPEENIIAPDPRVAVPAMQALTYSMNDAFIREMFANLLAADMNIETRKSVHPAFVELIKEMTPSDARVLKAIHEDRRCSYVVRFGHETEFYTGNTHYSFEIEGMSDDDIKISVNNLERLGLLERRDDFPIMLKNGEIEQKLTEQYEGQRKAFDTPEGKKLLHMNENAVPKIMFKRIGLYLHPLGVSFVKICIK